MSVPESPDDHGPTDADLFGLPQASREPGARGRDPIENLATEFLETLRRGQRADIETYAALYPQWAEQIRELFPMIAALEEWKTDREMQAVRGAMPEAFDVQQLGDCRILREIGRGGMGVVFEAEQAPIGRRVAVKLLPWKFTGRSRWRERFQKEARTAAALRHPHIVPIFSFGEEDGMYYYVMQLVEGVGLNRLIERLADGDGTVTTRHIAEDFLHSRADSRSGHDLLAGTANKGVLRRDAWKSIARIAWQAADAMRYAHRQGTLHRDLKPANLLIDARGWLWVADFGLAVTLEEAGEQARSRAAGTLRYMAPEQLEGSADERSDLYALGATLYELCTLRPAFAGDRNELVTAVLESRPLRPRKINPAIPRRLEDIVQTSMARLPRDRFQSADELLGALKSFIGGGGWDWLRWLPRGRSR